MSGSRSSGHGLVAEVGGRVQDLEGGAGRCVEYAGEGAIDALRYQNMLLKGQSRGVGKQQRLLQYEWRAGEYGRVGHVACVGLELLR